MRRSFSLFILTLLIAVTGCTRKPDAAIINFKNLKADIGHIKANSAPINVAFAFTNNGGKPLMVHNVVSDCTCTIINFPKKNISPGEGGTINVKLDPKLILAKGHFERPVVVRSNTNPRLHTLIIKMFVER